MRKTLIFGALVILALLYLAGMTLALREISGAKLVKSPGDLQLQFQTYSEQFTEPVDGSHLKFEKLGQYVYETKRGIAYRLSYKISTTDPSKPLAWTDNVKRNKCDYVLSEDEHGTYLGVSVNDSKYGMYWADGKYTEHWNIDGSIQCVGSVDFYSTRVGTWNLNYENSETKPEDVVGKPVSITAHTKHGYWGGAIDTEHASVITSLPVHSITIDFFVEEKSHFDKDDENE